MSSGKGKVKFLRKEGVFEGAMGFVTGDLHFLTSKLPYLNKEEVDIYNLLKFDAKKKSYLLGRLATKEALSVIFPDRMNTFHITKGVFGFPLLMGDCQNTLNVCLTHNNDIGIAFLFPRTHPVGLDIETINSHKLPILEGAMSRAEKKLYHFLDLPDLQIATMLWTIKESLSKILMTGLTLDFSLIEVASINKEGGFFIGNFSNFKQYKSISIVFTHNIFTLVLPKYSKINIEYIYKKMSEFLT